MNRFFRYDPPFQYYNSYYRNNPYSSHIVSEKNVPPEPDKNPPKKIEDNRFSNKPNNDVPVWFDIFGIKLYFDDVLILSLLFFLYKEEVKDEGLFLALVLLLIS